MDRSRDRRTADLAEWHRLLLDRLVGSEAEDRLDRLASHPALGGPELEFLKAQLAHRRGDVSNARSLVHTALQQLPGHQDFLDFCTEIGGPLPPRAEQIARERSR
jgi:ATP/maltotriose-dependent transcriptional regulator MalT